MKVLVAGDFAPVARLVKQIEEKRFSEVFPDNLCNVIKSADFSFVNFESPIAEEGFKPIPKCGPNLRCSKEAAEAVKYAGFTGATMANNHILDYGAEGLHKSEEYCRARGLDIVGIGNNLEDANKTLYLEKKGKRLAVINCCEHEFSIATATEAGANPLNPIRQFYAIQEAKSNADYILVIVHGGHEHYQLPSPRMQETYRFFIDAGADAVINHHQHCYSGYEVYHHKPIFYGLGNFCFDKNGMRECFWNEGYMVKLEFANDNIDFELIPYTQCNETASVDLVQDKTIFSKDIAKLNETISNPLLIREASERYYESTIGVYNSLIQPYNNRVFNKLFSMKILPSLFSNDKKIKLLNNINCESHLDRFIFALKKLALKESLKHT